MEPMRGLNFDWRICYKVVRASCGSGALLIACAVQRTNGPLYNNGLKIGR